MFATNAPFEFGTIKNGEIAALTKYDAENPVDAIILLLDKVLSSERVHSLKNIYDLIREYPASVPCFILALGEDGAAEDPSACSNEENESDLKVLLDEVLRRSGKILVSTNLARQCLVEKLGYAPEKILSAEDGEAKENGLLEKIKTVFPRWPFDEQPILKFNKDYRIDYDRLGKEVFKKKLLILPPKLAEEDGKLRLTCDFVVDGEKTKIWVDYYNCEKEWIDDRAADAFLFLALPYAMRTRHDLVCEAPVSENLLHNLREEVIPVLADTDSRLYRPRIVADTYNFRAEGDYTGVCFSGGVDSGFSLSKYYNSEYSRYRVTHILCGNYAYDQARDAIYQRAEKIARKLNLACLLADNNFTAFLGLRSHVYTHFYKTLAQFLPLKRYFTTIIYNSAYPLSKFNLESNATRDTCDYEFLLTGALTDNSFRGVDCSLYADRCKKVEGLVEFPAMNDVLNVCLAPQKEINCGDCEKCTRTLVNLDLYDSLELYEQVFDMDKYRKERKEKLKFVIWLKRHNPFSTMYREFIKKKDPDFLELVKRLERK